MDIKARINLDEDLIPHYPDLPLTRIAQANRSIAEKVKAKFVMLPCRPRVGNNINLQSFEAQFHLTEFERECLADCNFLVEITEVVICEGFLDVYVKKVE